jgi:hypothetical protein
MPAPGYPLSKINTLRVTSDKPLRRFASRALAKAGLAQRNHESYLGGLQAYAGDACWALSRDACQYILDFDERNPHVAEFFRYTHVPEESFYHTILGNSRFYPSTHRSLLYRYWPKAGHHPAMLDESHMKFIEAQEQVRVVDQFGSGEVLFARKFSDDDLGVVARLEAIIDEKERKYGMAVG